MSKMPEYTTSPQSLKQAWNREARPRPPRCRPSRRALQRGIRRTRSEGANLIVLGSRFASPLLLSSSFTLLSCPARPAAPACTSALRERLLFLIGVLLSCPLSIVPPPPLRKQDVRRRISIFRAYLPTSKCSWLCGCLDFFRGSRGLVRSGGANGLIMNGN